jgi:hypothetical protein
MMSACMPETPAAVACVVTLLSPLPYLDHLVGSHLSLIIAIPTGHWNNTFTGKIQASLPCVDHLFSTLKISQEPCKFENHRHNSCSSGQN